MLYRIWSKISTWKVFYYKKRYLLWKIWPISVKPWKPVWIRACKFDTQTKRVPAWPVINQLWFPERHFSANGISLRLGEVQMKIYKGSLQALLSSASRGFAARSRVLARLVSLAQIGELARRLLYISCRKAWKLDFWIQTKRVSRLSTGNIRAELTINNKRVLQCK